MVKLYICTYFWKYVIVIGYIRLNTNKYSVLFCFVHIHVFFSYSISTFQEYTIDDVQKYKCSQFKAQ